MYNGTYYAPCRNFSVLLNSAKTCQQLSLPRHELCQAAPIAATTPYSLEQRRPGNA